MAAQEDFVFEPSAEFKMMGVICQKVMTKSSSFGNAREMRTMLDEIIGRLSERVADMEPQDITNETYKTITTEDIADI